MGAEGRMSSLPCLLRERERVRLRLGFSSVEAVLGCIGVSLSSLEAVGGVALPCSVDWTAKVGAAWLTRDAPGAIGQVFACVAD